VSLTRKRAIYLALELDRSWTETIGVNPEAGTVFCEHGWPVNTRASERLSGLGD
jgi:hypothetical protein